MKKYLAECLGTFGLTLMVGLSLAGNFPVPTPVLATLTLGLFVYSVGHISGSHLNPAVTIGALSIGKVEGRQAIKYIVAQFLGAVSAIACISQGENGLSKVAVSGNMTAGFAEMVGMFFFSFGIASVMSGKVPKALSGIVVGGSLLLGIALSALLGSNGVLNPAVALGIGSFGVMYVVGPIIGAILGMNVYRKLQ